MKGPIKRLKEAAKQVEQIVAEEAPRDDKPAPKPKPKPKPKPDAPFVRGLGERLGITGIAIVTIGAALLGATGGSESAPSPSTPAVRPTCDEPASWCGAVTR